MVGESQKPKESSLGRRYISRMDYENNAPGWWARVPGGPSKYFKDRDHGGKRKALVAAKAYRDKEVAKRKIRPRVNKQYRVRDARSTTGVVGVCLYQREYRNKLEIGFRANWSATEGGKQKPRARSFSALRHGWTVAWQEAVKARYAGIRAHLPEKFPRPPRRPRNVLI